MLINIHNLEFFYRKLLYYKNLLFFSLQADKKIINEINLNSFAVVNNFLDKKICQVLIKEIDNYLLDDKKKNIGLHWSDKVNSDNRFFKFQEISIYGKKILENPMINNVATAVTGHLKHEKSLMANKLIYQTNNLGSGGGWHKDSPVRTQFKAFIYLSDVDDYNGPLQIFRGSHKFNFLKKIVKKKLSTKDYRFFDNEIDVLHSSLTSINAKAGTLILANTKALHRGMPIKKGSRYAITFYYGDPKLKSIFT